MWAKLRVRGRNAGQGRRPSGPGLSSGQSWQGRGQGRSHWVLNAGRSLLCDQTASCPFRLRPLHSHPGEAGTHGMLVPPAAHLGSEAGQGRSSFLRTFGSPSKVGPACRVLPHPATPLPAKDLSRVFVWLTVKVRWPSHFRQSFVIELESGNKHSFISEATGQGMRRGWKERAQRRVVEGSGSARPALLPQ